MITFTATKRLLFIGDSITDCGRREDSEQIGAGYVRHVRDYLRAASPVTAPIVINRGISGNKMPDLQKRWQRDVLEETPDVLSIYIGINDVWHGLIPGREGCDIDRFIAGYQDILTRTRNALPHCALILCEPSVIWPPVHEQGNEKLKPYIGAVHDIAQRFNAACVVPLHDAFNNANAARPDIAWTTDGVHPTSTGHMLIAHAWLTAVRADAILQNKCAGT
jgi:lysophospholipase L1-like esterase